jgi:hypothetical protein
MIIIKLMSGLGNQLFQFALGRRLSLERHVPLKLDISWYEKYAQRLKRYYQLDNYSIQAQIAEPSEVDELIRPSRPVPLSLYFRYMQRLFPYYRRRLIYERHIGFDSNILCAPKNACLVGYWQSEKYFKTVEHILRDEFEPREELHPLNARILEQIRSCCAVSLHIRRGDYLDGENSQIFSRCEGSYYLKAMDLMLGCFPDAHFFVFSDDLEWAEQNLAANPKLSYVANKHLERDWESIYLMSQCQHHIIANSSFSWWGAWLAKNPEKVVIAPRSWFVKDKNNNKVSLPENWLKI